MHAGNPSGENGWPVVSSVVCVHDLNLLSTNKTTGTPDESHLEWAFFWRGMERHAEVSNYRGKIATVWASDPDAMSEMVEACGELHALIIGTATREQRVELKNSERRQKWNW